MDPAHGRRHDSVWIRYIGDGAGDNVNRTACVRRALERDAASMAEGAPAGIEQIPNYQMNVKGCTLEAWQAIL